MATLNLAAEIYDTSKARIDLFIGQVSIMAAPKEAILLDIDKKV